MRDKQAWIASAVVVFDFFAMLAAIRCRGICEVPSAVRWGAVPGLDRVESTEDALGRGSTNRVKLRSEAVL